MARAEGGGGGDGSSVGVSDSLEPLGEGEARFLGRNACGGGGGTRLFACISSLTTSSKETGAEAPVPLGGNRGAIELAASVKAVAMG